MAAQPIVRQADTQAIGDGGLDAVTEAVLVVPSVIVPIAATPDRNYLINHRHHDVARITIVDDFDFLSTRRCSEPSSPRSRRPKAPTKLRPGRDV